MSEIIGMVGMSHSPFATMLPPLGCGRPGGGFLADVGRVAAAVAALAPDALVVIGPDHFHANFYDAMPPFVLGVEQAEAFGDFGGRAGPLPVASPRLVDPRGPGRTDSTSRCPWRLPLTMASCRVTTWSRPG